MRFLVLLAIVGLTAASRLGELKWEPEHEYVYSYSGRLLTGLPELAETHFSGIGIKCSVHLKVQSSSRIILEVRDPVYTKVNSDLYESTGSQEGVNWRHLRLPSYIPVPPETSRLLAEPTIFELYEETGKVRSVTVSSEEPEWSVNFKKALIVLFQTQTVGSPTVMTNSLREYSSSSEPTTSYWTTMEESLDGECETRYELNPLPKSLLLDLPEVCSSESSVYELVKVRDVNRCVRRRTFSFYKPGGFSNCGGDVGSCGGMYARSSVTRYVICSEGESYGYEPKFVIKKIVNEGELNQDLMGFKSEKMLTGTRQELKLVRKTRSSSSSYSSGPSSPITLNHLGYEYKLGKGPEHLKRELDSSSSSLEKTLPGLSYTSSLKRGEKERIYSDMKVVIDELVERDLFTPEGLPEKQITMKVLGLVKGFNTLNLEEMERMYRELKGRFTSTESKIMTFKNVFFDTCGMSGSGAAVKFMKKMILSGEVSRMQTESFLLGLPRSLVTPTTHILEEIFELVTSGKIREMRSEAVYNAGILSFGTLIQKACLSDNHNTSYPTYVFGRFCHPESYVVSDKWIPYLSRKLSESSSSTPEKKNVYIMALGLLGHKSVLPALYPVIERIEEHSPLNRALAVFSLVNVGRHYPSRVLPVLSAIFSNKAESPEVRIIAFNTIMKLSPDMALLQKIATLTWTETDYEVLKVVNTAFYSLSEQISMQDVKPASSSLVKKVRLMYPLIKKTGGAFPTSGTIFVNDYLNRLFVGYERTTSWINLKGSPLPMDYFSKITYFLDEYKFTPLEYGYSVRGTAPLVTEVLKMITGKSSAESGGESESEIVSKLSSEWRKVVEVLDIKKRGETGRSEGALMLRFFETSNIFKSFSEESIGMIRRKMQSSLKSGLLGGSRSGSGEVSFQRMLNLAPSVLMIPSDMGLPITIEVHLPVTMSAKGRFESSLGSSLGSASLSVKTMLAVQYVGWVGTVCPFTSEYIVTGVDEHAVLNIPAEISVKIEREEQKASIKIKPIMSGSSPIDVLHYHVRPFTVFEKRSDIRPMTLSPNFKPIRSRGGPPKRYSSSPRSDYLGLGLSYFVESESPVLSGSLAMLEKMELNNYNVWNMFRFSLVSTAFTPARHPSLRRHEIKIKYTPSEATTKEIDMSLKWGVATKEGEGMPIKYHTVKVEGGSEKRLVPFGVESTVIGEKSGHGVRQQKIKEAMEKVGIEEGAGIAISVTGSLIGSGGRPRTWSYIFSAGFGKDASLSSKWDVKLESVHSEKKICLNGFYHIPLATTLDSAEKLRESHSGLRFANTLGFGSTCSERKIKVEGGAKTSEMQKEVSRRSPEAREYQKLVREGAPLAHLSEVAELVKRQASVMDEVDFNVEYINVPSALIIGSDRMIDVLKLYWLPYLAYDPNEFSPSSSSSSYETSKRINVAVFFKTETKTFSVKIESPGETVHFSDIRMPYPISYYFPASYVAPLSPVIKNLIGGESALPVCRVESRWMRSYDNETSRVEMDECFHLLSGDCGKSKDFAVMIRKTESVSKEIKVFLKSTSVLLTPHGSGVVKVKVDGVELHCSEPGKSYPVKNSRGKIIATIEKSSRDESVIILKSTWVNVIFNGRLVKVEPSPLYASELCGLCGNFNSNRRDELVSPGMCLLSKSELLVASYRVSLPSKPCRPLESSIKEELRKETEVKCSKPGKKISTKIGSGGSESYSSSSSSSYSSSSYGGPSRGCYERTHFVTFRGSKTCFSRRPIEHCRGGCRPSREEPVEIGFHCMISSLPETKRTLERIRAGEIIPELARTSVDMEKSFPIPETCSRV
jgi:hypothetical protein